MNYALVTGGSRGIGRAICLELAGMGYNIIINYASNQQAAQEAKALVEAKGVKADLLPFDVSSPAAIEAALDGWKEAHPDDFIAVLVNNAGIRRDNMLVLMQDDEWNDVMATALNGFFHTTRHVLKSMVRKRTGRIINIVSVSGLTGLAGQANYSASRAAVIGATKALAKEVAARRITVNAVAPGYIDTDMTRVLSDEQKDHLQAQIPLGRLGSVDDIAQSCLFLASDAGAYITGVTLHVNGGMYMG